MKRFLKLLVTHCISAPDTPESHMLRVEGYSGGLTDFGDNVTLVCDRGHKYEEDFDRTEGENATCQEGNTWVTPSPLSKCVPSKGNHTFYHGFSLNFE